MCRRQTGTADIGQRYCRRFNFHSSCVKGFLLQLQEIFSRCGSRSKVIREFSHGLLAFLLLRFLGGLLVLLLLLAHLFFFFVFFLGFGFDLLRARNEQPVYVVLFEHLRMLFVIFLDIGFGHLGRILLNLLLQRLRENLHPVELDPLLELGSILHPLLLGFVRHGHQSWKNARELFLHLGSDIGGEVVGHFLELSLGDDGRAISRRGGSRFRCRRARGFRR